MLANWVRQQTSTTGTGDIVLDGAPDAGFISFSTAFRDGESVSYIIEDGNNREEGIGVLTAGANWTLTRSFITATLENGTYTENPASGIALSGSAVVGVVASARNTFPFIKKRAGGPTGFGTYRFSAHLHSSAANASTVADRVYYIPFIADETFTITKLGVRVGTAGSAGSVGQLGVYDFDNATSLATNLIAKTALFATDVTSNTVYTLDNSVRVHKGERLYLAFASNGAPSVWQFNQYDIASAFLNPLPCRIGGSYIDLYLAAYENLNAGWSSLPSVATQNSFLLGAAPAIWAGE